jgi:hypothetical protein
MSLICKKLNISFIQDKISDKLIELTGEYDKNDSIYIITYDINSTNLNEYIINVNDLKFPIPMDFQYKKIYYDFDVLTKLYSLDKNTISIKDDTRVSIIKDKLNRILEKYQQIYEIDPKQIIILINRLLKLVPETYKKNNENFKTDINEDIMKDPTDSKIIINLIKYYYQDIWAGGSGAGAPDKQIITYYVNDFNENVAANRNQIIKIIFNETYKKNNYDIFKYPDKYGNEDYILQNIYYPIIENNSKSTDTRYERNIIYNSNTDNIIKEYLQYVSDEKSFKDINDEYNAILYYNIYNIYKYFYLHSYSVLVYKDRIYTIQNIEPIKLNNFKITTDTIEISFKLNIKQEIRYIPSISIRYILIDNAEQDINIKYDYYHKKKQLSLLNIKNFNKKMEMPDKFFIDMNVDASVYSASNFASINQNINKNLEPIEFFTNKYNFLLFHNNSTLKRRRQYIKKLFLNKKKRKESLQPPYQEVYSDNLTYENIEKDDPKKIQNFIEKFYRPWRPNNPVEIIFRELH